MDRQAIPGFIEKADISIAKAMRLIDENAQGILFLTDDENKLIACVTDGDIRRFLLGGGSLDGPVLQAANRNPRIASTLEEAKSKYHRKNYVVIPVIDEDGRIVDLYTEGSDEKNKAALKIPVVINAGGRGTRLDPFTRVLPKALIPVGEIPIIELIMKEYQGYSCDAFHIIVNYKRNLMKAYFSENDNKYNITWYDEDQPLGTGGGLYLLKGKMNSTFFFSNCDALLKTNYERILQFHQANRNLITMVCAYKNISIPYGVVEMGPQGAITAMKEKPQLSFLTNTGIYLVEPEILEDMEDNVPIGFPEIAERERKKGKRVAAFPVSENEWMDMGQISELDKMRSKLYGE